MSKSKNWCFTVNNYTADQEEVLKNIPCNYLIYGREVGASGTPHLQGYIQLKERKMLSGVRKLLACHWEPAKGTPEQNKAYCSKDGDFHEQGVRTQERQRTDLIAFMDAVDNGLRNKRKLMEEHSAVVAKYPRFVKEYLEVTEPPIEIEAHPLNAWQEDLNQMLNREPSKRIVNFVVDPIGNKGKTWFAQYYCSLHDNAQYLESGKRSDLTHALRTDIRVLFVNCCKSKLEFLDYSFLEAVKDQMVFSPKYESSMKRLPPCHLVVMCNEMPNRLAMSDDRYNIIEI
ncbi:MAG: putative viral replication protein [Cressdnaviricota sp.]|nr:MAG: putative viral replication protein [Cressdnaviricota sp.]